MQAINAPSGEHQAAFVRWTGRLVNRPREYPLGWRLKRCAELRGLLDTLTALLDSPTPEMSGDEWMDRRREQQALAGEYDAIRRTLLTER